MTAQPAVNSTSVHEAPARERAGAPPEFGVLLMRRNALFYMLVFVLAAVFRPGYCQQDATAGSYMVHLEPAGKSISIGRSADLDLFVMDSKTMAAINDVTVAVRLSMPTMSGMSLDQPAVKPGKQIGHYSITAVFPHPGVYRLDLHLASPSRGDQDISLEISPGGSEAQAMQGMQGMPGMEGMTMHGTEMKASLGDWPMSREGSGTSWQPDASPMFMKMLPSAAGFDLALMGIVQSGYIDAGGRRGQRQGYANSMAMLMGSRKVENGTLGFDLMVSADPITNGKRGVPNLFQTGETLNGQPLVDRQHPHDLLSEAALSYSHNLGNQFGAFVYGGPVGEPALGNVMFMHRASGMEIPEAPISHHWFDSTHISFGVGTLGLTYSDKLKLEGSVFNGHEPDENRFDIDPITFNSASGRISYNPDRNWSFSASYGFLKSPEQLEPGVNQHRLTFSAAYSRSLANGDNLSATAYFGRLIVPGKNESNAFLAEATWFHRADAVFARYERVDKDELVGVPRGSYTINKLLLGDTHNFWSGSGFDLGLGGYVGLYSFPSALKPFYGSSPVTFGVFLRLRPSRG